MMFQVSSLCLIVIFIAQGFLLGCVTGEEKSGAKAESKSTQLTGVSSKKQGDLGKKTQQRRIPVSIKLAKVQGKGSATLGQTLIKHDVTLIQFWASWCVGCGEVMVEMSERIKKDPTLGFASVSIDEDMETAQGYFSAKPLEVKKTMNFVLLDPGGELVASPLNITELPYLVVASKDGRIHASFHGHPRSEDLTAVIAKARAQ